MEWIIFLTSAGQKYSLFRSLRLVSLPTWSVVAQLVVTANIIWEAWVRIPSEPGFVLAFSVVSFIEALLRGLCLHFFYCVLSYRLVSSLGTNQRRKFLPDYICKCGMRTPSRLTISLVSKFLKQSEPFLVRERIKNFCVRPIISDVIMPGTSQKSLQERVTGFKRGKMLPSQLAWSCI